MIKKYNYRTGLDQGKTKVRRYLAGISASAVLIASAIGFAVPFAANAQDSVYTHASACGQYHAAVADQYGNYGFLGGLHGTPYYYNGDQTNPGPKAVGQQPGATGYNNSQPCGVQAQ